MSLLVERHRLDLHPASDQAAVLALDRVLEMGTRQQVGTTQLEGVVDEAVLSLAYAAAWDSIDDEVRSALAIGAAAGAARLHAVTHMFRCSLGGPTVSIARAPLGSTTIRLFQRAWVLATLMNDVTAMSRVVLFSAERFAGAIDGRHIVHAQTLQAITESGVAGRAIEEPGPPGPPTPPSLQRITDATELMLRAYDGDPDLFDEALVRYLAAHRTLYQTPRRRRDVHGAVALLGLGLVAIRRERGIPVNVESPYLPLEAASHVKVRSAVG